MLKAFPAIGKMPAQWRSIFPATVAARQSSVSTLPPKAVIFDMGGVVLPTPLLLFKGLFIVWGVHCFSVYTMQCSHLNIRECTN